MDITRAKPEDAPRLSEIAMAAKAHWGYPPEWMEKWRADLTLTPEYIERDEVYAALDNGTPVAFYALVRQGDVILLDHLWVRPEQIGNGIGRELFQHARVRADSSGARRLELEAEPHAVGFYEKMGAIHLRDTVSDFGRVLPIMGLGLKGDRVVS